MNRRQYFPHLTLQPQLFIPNHSHHKSFASFHSITQQNYSCMGPQYGNGTNKFAYIIFIFIFGYFITTLQICYLDDADRVARAAIQRRARAGSPKDGFHDSRHQARIVGQGFGGGVGTNADEEEGEEQRCPTRQPPRHGAAAGKGQEEGTARP